MAFGTWLKKIVTSGADLLSRVIPKAGKIIQTVAPIAQQVGGLIGGKAGTMISNIAGGASNLAGMATDFVGKDGAGIRKLIPRLKMK